MDYLNQLKERALKGDQSAILELHQLAKKSQARPSTLSTKDYVFNVALKLINESNDDFTAGYPDSFIRKLISQIQTDPKTTIGYLRDPTFKRRLLEKCAQQQTNL